MGICAALPCVPKRKVRLTDIARYRNGAAGAARGSIRVWPGQGRRFTIVLCIGESRDDKSAREKDSNYVPHGASLGNRSLMRNRSSRTLISKQCDGANIIALSKIDHVELTKITRSTDIVSATKSLGVKRVRRLVCVSLVATLCASALVTARAQTQATQPDASNANVTGTLGAPPSPSDPSRDSVDNATPGLKIKVPDGFGGVTTLPDETNESKTLVNPDVSKPNVDRNQ